MYNIDLSEFTDKSLNDIIMSDVLCKISRMTNTIYIDGHDLDENIPLDVLAITLLFNPYNNDRLTIISVYGINIDELQITVSNKFMRVLDEEDDTAITFIRKSYVTGA